MTTQQTYKAHGKLLLSGEYLILEGAEGLAIPLQAGQELTVSDLPNHKAVLQWEATIPSGIWFKGTFSLHDFHLLQATDKTFGHRLAEILTVVRKQNPDFITSGSIKVQTRLEFNPEYGFGSSSTLIANLARWAGVDAFELQKQTFKGSGYDVAVALENNPINYKLQNGKPQYHKVPFNPDFAQNLYFVYLGKKQRSLDAIKQFKKKAAFTPSDIDNITAITREISTCRSLPRFEHLLQEHETIMSAILKTSPVQQQLFSNYTGGIVKSLGAWGGDFVLITSKQPPESFKKLMISMGFKVVFGFNEIVATD